MSSFIRHLKDIAATISVDEETKKFLAQDFAIVREYIFEVLKKHSLFKHLLTEPTFIGKHFNTSIVLDLAKFYKLNSIFSQNYPPYVEVVRCQRTKNTALLGIWPKFLCGLGSVDGEAIINFVRATLDFGLKQNGCFIRGHRGDIYELELCKPPKKHIITIEAVSVNLTISIDFRILLNLAPESRPDNPVSFPQNISKQIWLVRPDQSKNPKIFAIVTPFNENLMSSCQSFTMAYRLLARVFVKMNLYNVKEELLLSTIYEVIYSSHKIVGSKGAAMETVAHDILKVLQRMVAYFGSGIFPYYWNTRINMLNWFNCKNSQNFVYKALYNLLNRFYAMNVNHGLSYDEVQEFFGKITTTSITCK